MTPKQQSERDRRHKKMSVTVDDVKGFYDIGDKVFYTGRGYEFLREGDTAKVVDIQPGIFGGDVYVTIETPEGRRASGYDWRFVKQ